MLVSGFICYFSDLFLPKSLRHMGDLLTKPYSDLVVIDDFVRSKTEADNSREERKKKHEEKKINVKQ